MIEEMRTIRTHLLATAACLLLCVGARAETLDVCPTGCTYASIQNAIDASSDGDTIAVAAGTYHEFDITLQGKAITISGDTDSNGLPAVTIDSQGMGTNIIGFFGEGNDTIIEHLIRLTFFADNPTNHVFQQTRAYIDPHEAHDGY